MKQNRFLRALNCFLFIGLLSFSVNLFAQVPGGMGGMGGPGGMGGMGRAGGMRGGFPGQGNSSNKMKEINFLESAGIHHYIVDEVCKKLKIKDDNIKEKLKNSFICYEDSLVRISMIYPKEYEVLNNAKENMEMIRKSGDIQNMRKYMAQIKNCTDIISPVTHRYNKNLNNDLKTFLSEKEMKKWNEYIEKLNKTMPNGNKMGERPQFNGNKPEGMGEPFEGEQY